MRVKDLLQFIKKHNIPESCMWLLVEKGDLRGNIYRWEYKDEELIGYARPAVWKDDKRQDIGTLEDVLRTIKIYNVPDDTELCVYVPDYGKLQLLTNWRYDKNNRKFSSAVWWEMV